MGAVSFVFLLLLLLCPVLIGVHCSGVFQEHTHLFFLVEGQAIRPSGNEGVYVFVEVDAVGQVVFFDFFS